MLNNLNVSDREYKAYSVGALMYTPATNGSVANNLYNNKFIGLNSLVLCLEDSILDYSVSLAEEQLMKSLFKIYEYVSCGKLENIPLIFVRVRNAQQMKNIFEKLNDAKEVLTGFVLPKFDLSNADLYIETICNINNISEKTFYIMPILESKSIIHIETRIETLLKLKSIIDKINPFILNVRVGGNDFCNIYRLRRNVNQTVYDMGIVNSVLIDILNIFSRDYVLSAPVWEYFENNISDDWIHGLKKELELDILNGFIGKTAIHPSQLPIISNSLKVSEKDLEDAKSILNWNDDVLGVGKSVAKDRMNEVSVHSRWARKIIILADIYGIKKD